MIASQVVIDRTSRDWVHHSFNLAFLSDTRAATGVYIGRSDSSAFQSFDREKEAVRPGYFATLLQLAVAARRVGSRTILFLCMSNRDILLVATLRVLGYDVNYVMHKLNLRSRLLKRHLQLLYRMLDLAGVNALCLEPPHPVFRRFRIIELNLYSDRQRIRPVPHIAAPYRRIAYIGVPEEGKNFPLLESLAHKLGFAIIVFSDAPVAGHLEQRPHTNVIHDCDFIWGYYRKDHYQGIQSGLGYVALDSVIRILTNQSIGFVSFAAQFPEHGLSLANDHDLEHLLAEVYGKRDA